MKTKKITALVMAVLLIIALCSCSKSNKKQNVQLSSIMTQINKECSLDNMIALETADQMYKQYEIDAKDIKSFSAEVSSDSLNQNEVVMVEAQSSDAMKRIKEKLENSYNKKLDQSRDYLPDEYEMIKKCTVSTNGNYVRMFISDNAEKMTSIYKSYF